MRLPVRLRQAFALLDPPRLRSEVARVRDKWRRRRARPEDRRVTLRPSGSPRGDVLISYILDGFLRSTEEPIPHGHTHYWESLQIARTFVELGYRVDVVSWRNGRFPIERPYRAVVDVRLNLERWAAALGSDCVKVLHAETAHRSFHNPAQHRRLEELYQRRGASLAPQKLLEPNRAIESADCVTILGNEFTMGTYAFVGKPLYRIPISSPQVYEELGRDDGCRSRFLWFGSGGLVHKGLDRVLEAFAGTPELSLTVCGPVQRERDFERAYYRELYDTPNIRTLGWVDIASPTFLEVARRTLAVVYPSCSEGGGGGVVTCMHAGLIPVVTFESSVDIAPSFGVQLPDAGVETIRRSVRELAARPWDELLRMGREARAFARANHTRERFAVEYRRAVEAILERFGGG